MNLIKEELLWNHYPMNPKPKSPGIKGKLLVKSMGVALALEETIERARAKEIRSSECVKIK